MGALSNPPPEVVQGQRGTLVDILRLWALCVIYDVQKMLQFYGHSEKNQEVNRTQFHFPLVSVENEINKSHIMGRKE